MVFIGNCFEGFHQFTGLCATQSTCFAKPATFLSFFNLWLDESSMCRFMVEITFCENKIYISSREAFVDHFNGSTACIDVLDIPL